MITDQDIARMLLAGHSQHATCLALHVSSVRVRTIREGLGLPRRKPGPMAETIEVTFARRTEATEDGHLIWQGRDLAIGTTDGANYSAARYSFRRRYGRNPIGKVTPGCGVHRCVHPDHVEDQPMRQQYSSIFG